MKRFSMVLSLLLMLSLVLGILAGCKNNDTTDNSKETSSVEETPVTVESLMDSMKSFQDSSYSFDMSMSLKMSMNLFGEKSDIAMTLDFVVKANPDIAYLAGTGVMEADGETEENSVEMYIDASDETPVTYTKTDDVWEKSTNSEANIGSFMDNEELINVVLRDKTEKKGTKTCYVVDAEMNMSKMSSVLGEDFDIGEMEVNIPVVLYFDSTTKELLSMEVNCGKELSDMIQKAMLEEQGFTFALDIEEFKIVVDNIDTKFSDVITIPDDVKENAVDADDWNWDDNYVEWQDAFNELVIGGTTLNIREITFQDIMNLRGNNEDVEDLMVEAKDYDFRHFDIEGFGRISFGLENPSDETCYAKDCIIYYVAVTPFTDKDIITDTTVAGIRFFQDTMEDLIERFGEPSGIDEDWDDSTTLTWEDSNMNEFTVTLDKENGTVIDASIYLFD